MSLLAPGAEICLSLRQNIRRISAWYLGKIRSFWNSSSAKIRCEWYDADYIRGYHPDIQILAPAKTKQECEACRLVHQKNYFCNATNQNWDWVQIYLNVRKHTDTHTYNSQIQIQISPNNYTQHTLTLYAIPVASRFQIYMICSI